MEEDVLDVMLLEPVDNWQLASPTSEEDTALLGKAHVVPVRGKKNLFLRKEWVKVVAKSLPFIP